MIPTGRASKFGKSENLGTTEHTEDAEKIKIEHEEEKKGRRARRK
jgi:hypothetical protein